MRKTGNLALAPCLGKRLAADIIQAQTQQTVIVPGTNAAVVVIPHLTLQLITLRKQRDEVALEVEQRVLAHPLYTVLASMPGVDVRTAARRLTEVACRTFASAAYLAALCRPCAGNPTLRLIHTWGTSLATGQ